MVLDVHIDFTYPSWDGGLILDLKGNSCRLCLQGNVLETHAFYNSIGVLQKGRPLCCKLVMVLCHDLKLFFIAIFFRLVFLSFEHFNFDLE